MKEIINVSISGIGFSIQADAYESLKKYLSKIDAAYANEEGGMDIIADIEARIAELLLSRDGDASRVVTVADVSRIIAMLGEPEQNGAEPSREEATVGVKRLYRSREGAMVGGVFSGLAAYFNIDVAILRILFAIFIFIDIFFIHSTGWLILCAVYLLVWIVVPVAKTALQKMELKGEPITASTIESRVREELNEISANPKTKKAAGFLSKLLTFFGYLLKLLMVFIVAVVEIALIAVLVLLFVALVILVVASFADLYEVFPKDFFIALPLLAISAVIPLLLLVYLVLRGFFNTKWPKVVVIILFIFWVLSWSITGVVFMREGLSMMADHSEIDKTTIEVPSNRIYIDIPEEEKFDKVPVSLSVIENENLAEGVYEVIVSRYVVCFSKKKADRRIEEMGYPVNIADSVITVRNVPDTEKVMDNIFPRKIIITVRHSPGAAVIER